MVELEGSAAFGVRRIVLRPHSSLSLRQARWFLGTMAVIMGAIGAGFAALGLWLVLPFSGAEWLLLAWCFRENFKSSQVLEVITIDADTVVVEQGGRPERTHSFRRGWLTLERTRGEVPGAPSRLLLRLHARRVEVGRFLTENEREFLAQELHKILTEWQILK